MKELDIVGRGLNWVEDPNAARSAHSSARAGMASAGR
jgi:hypothetical protein